MTLFTTIVHVLVCLFLISVILLQAGRGQGLSWGTFGGSPQSILGTKTASFLTKVTTACAIIFLLTCIGLNILETTKQRSLFGPTKPLSQVDFEKIKEALEQADEEVTQQGTAELAPDSEVPIVTDTDIQETVAQSAVEDTQTT
jgi:preprotein translocase subunit SecG